MVRHPLRRTFLLAGAALPALPAGPANLLDPSLSQWESIGDGVWTIMRDGTLLGQRRPKESKHQAWLYTKRDFGQYDLHLEWWTVLGGNSGVSILDTSRARWAVPPAWNAEKTPSHIGHEIQISNGYRDEKYPSGSIYLFAPARPGAQIDNDWNAFDISVRDSEIRVKLNGVEVASHPAVPGRPKRGPVGLQLHDARSVAKFRNIRIEEIR
ncbi:MAG: DUF1080 domain-containing protein [Bryobacterales bacterium]|nr:DUF1080 domain-containing protein [Bryobacterales bacterium]